MRTNTEVKLASAEEGERMVLPLLPVERDTAKWYSDFVMGRIATRCGGYWRPFPSLFGGFIRDIICGKDARYLNWDFDSMGFTDDCLLAIEDDACYDHETYSGSVTFKEYHHLEDAIICMVTTLLKHRAYRAAHNALNVLVACDSLFRRKRAAMEDALKHPQKDTSFPF